MDDVVTICCNAYFRPCIMFLCRQCNELCFLMGSTFFLYDGYEFYYIRIYYSKIIDVMGMWTSMWVDKSYLFRIIISHQLFLFKRGCPI